MTDTQILTIALSTAPTMLLVLVGILINNARLGDTNTRIGETNSRIGELRSHMDVRFEEMKDLSRSELHRVEEVIDARLKHIERR
jgi:cell division protein FtsL